MSSAPQSHPQPHCSYPTVTSSTGLVIPLRVDTACCVDMSTFTHIDDWVVALPILRAHIWNLFHADRVVQSSKLLFQCIHVTKRFITQHQQSHVTDSTSTSQHAHAHSHSHAHAHAPDHTQTQATITTTSSTPTDTTTSTSTSSNITQLQQQLEEMENGKTYAYIRDVKHELDALRESCRDEKEAGIGWTKLNENAGIVTYYRKDPNCATHSFKVTGEVHAPVFNLVAIVYEIDLFSRWLPAIHSSTKLCHIDGSRYRMLAQLMVDVPWPIANRECLFYGYGDVMDGEVAIFFRSIRDDEVFTSTQIVATSPLNDATTAPPSSPEAQASRSDPDSDPHPDPNPNPNPLSSSSSNARPIELPPVPPKHVRCEIHVGGFIIHPIDANKSQVTAIFNLDPKLSLIPYWFINMVSSKFCSVLIELLRQHAPKLDTEFERRISTNRRVYGEIERRLCEVDPTKQHHTKQPSTSQRHQHQHQHHSEQTHPS